MSIGKGDKGRIGVGLFKPFDLYNNNRGKPGKIGSVFFGFAGIGFFKKGEVMDKILEVIKKYAAKQSVSDQEDFIINDYASGNIDDAFWLGYEDGVIIFARELLKKIEEK